MSNFEQVDKLLVKLIDELNAWRKELKELYAPETKGEETVPEQAVELVPITLVEVRTRLAELSRDGKTNQVRALIEKFGASKLSEIDPKHYPAIMDAAVEIDHGKR